jgi:hypothetical protein
MKASINEEGLLSIYAETPTERYALKQWWRNFQQGDNESGIAALFNEYAPAPTSGTH